MSRRIDIELTSARDDGSWTWRAAGARQPKGTIQADILPESASVGDVLRVEVEAYLDGMDVVAVVPPRAPRREPERLELRSAQPDDPSLVTSVVSGKRSSGRPKGRARGRDRDERQGGPRRDGGRRPERRDRRESAREGREGREGRDGRDRRDGTERDRRAARAGRRTRPAPSPTETKPRPKRLRPGKTHRTQLLGLLPVEQRPIAEQLLAGGIPAVRQAIDKQNASLRADGKPEVKPDALLRVAEELRPRVLAALWRDRAEAAVAAVDELDLRDLRSVVNAADDAGRDKEARTLAAQLREALANRVEKEHAAWLAELTEMLRDGRVVRALRLSSRPPKAGAPIPPELTVQLTDAASAALTQDTGQERWATVLDALAFSPVRRRVVPQSLPTKLSPELAETIARLGSRLPEIAHIFDIEPVETPARSRQPRRRGGKSAGDKEGPASKTRDTDSSAKQPKAPRSEDGKSGGTEDGRSTGGEEGKPAGPEPQAVPAEASSVAELTQDTAPEEAAAGALSADAEVASGESVSEPTQDTAPEEAAAGALSADAEVASGESVSEPTQDTAPDEASGDVETAAETAPDHNGATDAGQSADVTGDAAAPTAESAGEGSDEARVETSDVRDEASEQTQADPATSADDSQSVDAGR